MVDTTKSFTVAAWVKLNTLGGFQTFVSEDSGFQATFFLQKRGDTNTFTFTQPFGAAGGPGVAVYADSGITPTAGTWYHVTGVYDALQQSASIYVNGVLAGQVYSVSPSPANGHTGIGHGQYNNSYVDWVNGAIDDVRLYQAALTPDQILAIARIGNPSLPGPQPVEPAKLDIDGAHPGAHINPKFYGLMTEEINHSYDGGIYGELIQNRVFKDDPNTPVHWLVVQDKGGTGSITLDTTQPVTDTALTNSLRIDVNQGQRVGWPGSFENDVHHYDSYKRTGPKIFVGEWASQEGFPTPNLHAALGDAAWLTGLERNSDIVILESYAPLLVNVNPGASQWATNLIGYDALQSYGSPSYYVQVMFSNHHGDVVLPSTLTATGGSKVYASVTRDSRSGTIYLKVVNAAADPRPLHVNLNGINGVSPTGEAVVLTSTSALQLRTSRATPRKPSR